MRYFEEVYDSKSGITYSCDMVRFSIEARKDCTERFANRFNADSRLDVNMRPISYAPFKYRQLLTVDVGESAVTIGMGFNGCGGADERLRGFVEFNPNKVFPEWRNEFIDICGWCVGVECTRLDVAIDIPTERENVSLIKDNRLYKCVKASASDFTEYLGRHNNGGFVKLYNKSLEQKLRYPLTRLEITTEPNVNEFKKHIPQVVISGLEQIDIARADMSELSQNDRVTVALLNTLDLEERSRWLQRYTYRHRQKIERYVLAENRLQINTSCVRQVIDGVLNYTRLSA